MAPPFIGSASMVRARMRKPRLVAVSLLTVVLLTVVSACVGPVAPDVALCRDAIHRLCLEPRCTAVSVAFGVGDTCEALLVGRSGCAADEFTFSTSPDRSR